MHAHDFGVLCLCVRVLLTRTCGCSQRPPTHTQGPSTMTAHTRRTENIGQYWHFTPPVNLKHKCPPPRSLYARQCASFVALQATLKRCDAQIPVFIAPKTVQIGGFLVLLVSLMKVWGGGVALRGNVKWGCVRSVHGPADGSA